MVTDWNTYIDDTVERSDLEDVGKSDFTLDLDRAGEQLQRSELGEVLEFTLTNGASFNAVVIGTSFGEPLFFVADSNGEMRRAYGPHGTLNMLRNFIITELSGVAGTKRF